jgi:hypothetical protein
MQEVISINTTGEATGTPYMGDFTVKLQLTKKEQFRADAIRREILGPSPLNNEPAPKLQTDAFIIGQLAVRIEKAPKFWTDSSNGLDLPEGDDNLLYTLYNEILTKIEDQNTKLREQAKKALETLAK